MLDRVVDRNFVVVAGGIYFRVGFGTPRTAYDRNL